MLVEILDFLSSPLAFANGDFLAKELSALDKNFSLLLVRLHTLVSDSFVDLVELLFNMLQILLEQLIGDDIQVPNGVDFTLVMHDFFSGESSHDVEDAIDSLDVGQEGVAEALSLTGSGDEAGDIENRDAGGHLGTGLEEFAKPLESLIGHKDFGLGGVDSAERVVLCRYTEVGEHVEGGGLADIGQADETHFERV